jgi:hypothetical protein
LTGSHDLVWPFTVAGEPPAALDAFATVQTLPATQSQIIEAFDDCLEYVYGRQYGRDNPHKYDTDTAELWIAAGLTVTVACFVFYRQMNLMHEKWLRDQLRDRSHIPHCLKVFDENIEAGIRHQKQGDVTTWEMADSQWRSRLKVWIMRPDLWRTEMWGPPPGDSACRAPRSVMVEVSA